MADERFPCCRLESMLASKADTVECRYPAISLRAPQKASSRLTLVLCPARTTDRLTTRDFMLTNPPCCVFVAKTRHRSSEIVAHYGPGQKSFDRCRNHTEEVTGGGVAVIRGGNSL